MARLHQPPVSPLPGLEMAKLSSQVTQTRLSEYGMLHEHNASCTEKQMRSKIGCHGDVCFKSYVIKRIFPVYQSGLCIKHYQDSSACVCVGGGDNLPVVSLLMIIAHTLWS